MENRTGAVSVKNHELEFDLGSFEGFNFRTQSAIERTLTGEEVLQWDHDLHGEAEFWPAGDNEGVSLVFGSRTSVTVSHLLDLDRALHELSGDCIENYLRIHHAANVRGFDLATLTANTIEDISLHIFVGDCLYDLRKEAAYELFETYWPEAYKMWESCNCDGLIFDTDVFLDSPSWEVEEVTFGDKKAMLVSPQ